MDAAVQTETATGIQTGTQASVGASTTATQKELTLSPEDTVIVVPRVGGVLRLEAFPEPSAEMNCMCDKPSEGNGPL